MFLLRLLTMLVMEGRLRWTIWEGRALFRMGAMFRARLAVVAAVWLLRLLRALLLLRLEGAFLLGAFVE